MARKRMIDPGIWGDEGFIELSNLGKIMFLGLISHADDEGKGIGSSKSLKANIFPAEDISLDEIDHIKEEIRNHTRTRFYTIDGKEYYILEKWNCYQSVNHPQKSAIPNPSNDSCNDSGTVQECSRNDTGTVQEDSPQLINKLINKDTPSADADASLNAFNLYCKINDWINKIDGLYEPIEKPNNGAAEWKYLQRMAEKIRSPELVPDIFNRLHHKGKLDRGFITSWMPKEVGICMEEIHKEAALA